MNYNCLNLCQKSDLNNHPPPRPSFKKVGNFHYNNKKIAPNCLNAI